MSSQPSRTSGDNRRYEALETDSGNVIIFDSEEPNAWVQSDLAVDVTN